MPILGVVSSAFRVPSAGFEWIATATAVTDTNTLSFSNIPQTYSHLRLVGVAKTAYTNSGTGESGYKIQWGSGSTPITANYFQAKIFGAGNTSKGSSVNTSSAQIEGSCPWNNTGGFGTSLWGPVVVDIFNYTSTTQAKVFSLYKGFACNNTSGNTNVQYVNGRNPSTAAINYILLDSTPGYADGAFLANTTFNLYGVK